jgi:hypothetical protein
METSLWLILAWNRLEPEPLSGRLNRSGDAEHNPAQKNTARTVLLFVPGGQ